MIPSAKKFNALTIKSLRQSAYKVKIKILVFGIQARNPRTQSYSFCIDALHRVTHHPRNCLGVKSKDVQSYETEIIVSRVRQIGTQFSHDSIQILVDHPFQFLLVTPIDHADNPFDFQVDPILLPATADGFPILGAQIIQLAVLAFESPHVFLLKLLKATSLADETSCSSARLRQTMSFIADISPMRLNHFLLLNK